MKTKRESIHSGAPKQARRVANDRRPSAGKVAARIAAPGLKLKRILVPIDFSESALKALRYAVPMAEEFGAEIYLVYVAERPLFNDLENVMPLVEEKTMINVAREKLLRLAGEEIDELVPVQVEVRVGRPFDEIDALAASAGIDLIVIATHGYTGLKHVLLGSTAERVVRHATCPVLVVREQEREFV